MIFYHNVFQKRTASIIKGFCPELSYVENSSWVHRLHPLVKLVMLISFSLTVFAVPTCLGDLFSSALCWFYGLAGLGLAFFYRKLRFIMVFGLFIFIIQVWWFRKAGCCGRPVWDRSIVHLVTGPLWGFESGFAFCQYYRFQLPVCGHD